MIVLRNIPFKSHCEHHLAPIIGTTHIGYLPDQRVVGISKLAQVVDAYAARLTIQEKMTAQIANLIDRVLDRGAASMHEDAQRAQARHGAAHPSHARRIPPRPADPEGVPGTDRNAQNLTAPR